MKIAWYPVDSDDVLTHLAHGKDRQALCGAGPAAEPDGVRKQRCAACMTADQHLAVVRGETTREIGS